MENIDKLIDNGHTDRFIEELSLFRESGQDINMIDAAGYTWLTRAIVSGHIESYPNCTEIRVQAVLSAGADPNRSSRDALPIIYACGWQYGYGAGPSAQIVKMLLNAGANPSPQISITLPKSIIIDNDIDFSEEEFIEIRTVKEWLEDLTYQNNLIGKYHPEMFNAVRRTEKEIQAIQKLLE